MTEGTTGVNQQSSTGYSIHSVKRFYFLDYFYIVLESINRFQKLEEIFMSFLALKRRYRLGESKYKKLTTDYDNITDEKMRRYLYTFYQVTDESREYGLVDILNAKTYHLTDLPPKK